MVFIVDAFFQIPSSSFCKKGKEVKNEEKTVYHVVQGGSSFGVFELKCLSVTIQMKLSYGDAYYAVQCGSSFGVCD